MTCFVVRKGYRGRGLTYPLARATIDFARERGARALEAYPMITQPGKEITWGEAARGGPSGLRGRRVQGGQPPHRPAGGHADRLRTRGRRTLTDVADVITAAQFHDANVDRPFRRRSFARISLSSRRIR